MCLYACLFSAYCTPNALACIADVSGQDLGCKVSSTGLYADKEHSDITMYADKALYQHMTEIVALADKGIFTELQKIAPLH